MVKRIISIVLATVLFSLTLSGCSDFVKSGYGFIKSFFEFWDGMTIGETKSYVKEALKEKYGEEFIVNYVDKYSGDYYTNLVGNCSPKSDEDIVFDIEVYVRGENENSTRWLYDNYIQNVVRKQVKQIFDEVLQKYYNDFAAEVFVTPLKPFYNSGIRSANEATIENFSKTFSASDIISNDTSVWIAIKENEKENGVEKLENILQEMAPDFYLLNVYVDFFYTDEETIKACNEKIYSKNPDRWAVKDILNPHDYPFESFVCFNDERGIKYCGNEIMY